MDRGMSGLIDGWFNRGKMDKNDWMNELMDEQIGR